MPRNWYDPLVLPDGTELRLCGTNPPGGDVRAFHVVERPKTGWDRLSPSQGAVLLMGLVSAGHQRKFSPHAVRTAIRDLRSDQLTALAQEKGCDPRSIMHGATVVPALGYWAALDIRSKKYNEPSVSISILNLAECHGKPLETAAEFNENMLLLAEYLTRAFRQDYVIVQLTHGNVVKKVWGVGKTKSSPITPADVAKLSERDIEAIRLASRSSRKWVPSRV